MSSSSPTLAHSLLCDVHQPDGLTTEGGWFRLDVEGLCQAVYICEWIYGDLIDF